VQSYVDMSSLIDKALKHVNKLWQSLILCKHIIVLDIKGAHNVKHFYDTPIVEIPTNKGANSVLQRAAYTRFVKSVICVALV